MAVAVDERVVDRAIPARRQRSGEGGRRSFGKEEPGVGPLRKIEDQLHLMPALGDDRSHGARDQAVAREERRAIEKQLDRRGGAGPVADRIPPGALPVAAALAGTDVESNMEPAVGSGRDGGKRKSEAVILNPAGEREAEPTGGVEIRERALRLGVEADNTRRPGVPGSHRGRSGRLHLEITVVARQLPEAGPKRFRIGAGELRRALEAHRRDRCRLEREMVAVERCGGVLGRRLDQRRQLHAGDRAAGLGRERKRTELTNRSRGAEAPRDFVRRRVDGELEIDPFPGRNCAEVVRLPGGDKCQVYSREDQLDRGAV